MIRFKFTAASAGIVLALCTGSVSAADVEEGVERIGEGVVDTVTSPGKIVEGVSEGAQSEDPVAGTVGGAATGTVDAAGQAIKGGAEMATGAAETGAGIVEKVLEPVTGE